MMEATIIDGIVPDCVYATCWKAHKLECRTQQLEYVTVLGVSYNTKSGELVKTNRGNRVFSKLRWFGPLASKLSDLL